MQRLQVYYALRETEKILEREDLLEGDKIAALKDFISTVADSYIIGSTYDAVCQVAKEAASVGKSGKIKVMLQLLGVEKLEKIKHDQQKLAAFYDFLKIL